MFKKLLFLLFFSSAVFGKSIPEKVREQYALEMHEAFFLQSLGRSTEAFFKSKSAYENAINAGESVQKLDVVLELFRWYRKYGYAAGVMLHPSGCIDEYRASGRNSRCMTFGDSFAYAYGYGYESEWGKTPEQAKHVRQFMLGVGMVISGVFLVTVNPPVTGYYGGSLVVGGFTNMYLGLSNGVAEWENRVQEVQRIELKAHKLANTK